MKQVFLTLLACFFYLVSLAQNDSITNLNEIILIKDFIKKKAIGITPSSNLVIADLQQYSPIDFATGLNEISGVYVLSGALNTNRITIRGVGARTPFGTDKLRMYFNGIPVTTGSGISAIEAYDFENMGRIEIVKGPKGTTLGANLGGAILLNTKAPEVGNTFLKNTFTIGSFNMLKDNLSFRHSEKKFNFNFNYNHLQTDGFRQNNSFQRNGFLATSSFKLHPKGKLDLLLNYIDYTAKIPSSINQTNFSEDPRRAAPNWLAARGFEANKYTLAGASYTYFFNTNLKTTNSIFYTYLDHYEPRPFNILDEFTSGFGFRSITKGKFFNGDFTFGAELYKDEYNWQTFDNLYQENNGNGSLKGNQISKNKEFRSQLNLFSTYAYKLTQNFTAQIGLAFNSTSFNFRDLFNEGDENTSAKRDFDPIMLPSLGLQYQLKKGSLYTNFGRGFSNPGLEETLTPDGLINPEIKQEKGINFEFGGRFLLLEKKLNLTLSAYQMNSKDLLVAERINEDQFIGRNAGETKHQGIDLDFRYQQKIDDNWVLFPRLSYSYSNHSFINFIDAGNNFSGNRLAGVPKHRINAGIALHNKQNLVFNFIHQFVDKIPLNDANTLSSESFNIFNFSARYSTNLITSLTLSLNFGFNNIFNTNYAQSVLINAVGFGGAQPRYFYPGNARNYYAGMQLNYVL